MPPARVLVPAAATVCAALITGGCSVSVTNSNDSPNASASPAASASGYPSIVHDHKATLDFTERPTRKSLGMPAGETFMAYQRVGPMFEVTVKLPTGTFTTPAFEFEGATNTGGGAGDEVKTHEPKYFNVAAKYPTGRDAVAAVLARAEPLGIHPEDVKRLEDVVGQNGTVPQSRVVRGVLDDWLSVEVVLTDQPGTEVQVQYEFNIDVYHNEAVDKILRDGVLHLPLTHRPTREELGFLPTYNSADVQPEPEKTMSVVLDTPEGPVQVPANSVTSGSGDPKSADDDPRGVRPPGTTMIYQTGTNAEIRRTLDRIAPVFGIDPDEIGKAMTTQGAVWHASTPVYDVKIVAGGDPERTDDLSASLQYYFTWKSPGE